MTDFETLVKTYEAKIATLEATLKTEVENAFKAQENLVIATLIAFAAGVAFGFLI